MRGLPTLRFATAMAVGIFSTVTASDARAEDAPKPVSGNEMSRGVVDYYDGESVSAYVILNLSFVEVGAGAVLVNEHFDFARGLGWPLLTLGALEAIGSIFYAFQVDDESSHYQALLSRDPKAFKQEE